MTDKALLILVVVLVTVVDVGIVFPLFKTLGVATA